MIKVSIIGSGNVAQHLIVALQNSIINSAEMELVQVYARQKATVSQLLDFNKITNDWNTLAEADLYIIAVSDDAISTVSEQIPYKNKLVVHTSGVISLENLASNNRKGVFYPLQTFSKNKAVNFKSIPICLESQNASDFQLLQKVALAISDSVFAINSEQRKVFHVAAVFVNNFTNHLYEIGNDICIKNNVPFEILKPLIKETAEKITNLSPNEAQTGPAIRNDIETINAHLSFLSDENQKNIYKMLTKSIQNNGKKL
ncbi:MAG: DUF2520 domain-containing protein [Flavobacteriaceae bacterium]|nr:DUF2520 domain-containing protein [Flavobacteriaceae bacterium]